MYSFDDIFRLFVFDDIWNIMQIRTPLDLGLDLPLTIEPGDRPLRSSDDVAPVDIDAIVDAAKGDRR